MNLNKMNAETRIRVEEAADWQKDSQVNGMDILAHGIILALAIPVIAVELVVFLPIYLASNLLEKFGGGRNRP